MPAKTLAATIAGVTNIYGIDIAESYGSVSKHCTIECESTTLNIGDAVSVDMGFSSDHGVAFTGYVKKISDDRPGYNKRITCFDEMVLAADYFIAAEDPNNPFTRTNISAEDLVGDILALAGITNYVGSVSSFTFTEPSFNLTTSADAANQVSNIIAWHIWADENGQVHFADRKPYVMAGDTASFSLTVGSSGNILSNTYTRSDEGLRNKVVVYGDDPIAATASAVSPYLPSGFYKTAVIASPLITSQSQAQSSANYNLVLYNRLTESISVEIEGKYNLHVNSIVSINEPGTGVTGDWFVYSASHAWGKDGYVIRLELRK